MGTGLKERVCTKPTMGGGSKLLGTVTPGGVTLAMMSEMLVAVQDLVQNLGCILNSTWAYVTLSYAQCATDVCFRHNVPN